MKWNGFLIVAGISLLLQGCATQQRMDSDLQALHREAQAAYDSGDDLKAESAYKALSVRQPQEAETWLRLGNVYARNKYLDKAIDAYGKSLKINPTDARPLNNLTIVHLRKAWMSALAARQASMPEQAAYQISGEIIAALEGLPYVAEVKTDAKPDPLRSADKVVLQKASGSASAVDQQILPESPAPDEGGQNVDLVTAKAMQAAPAAEAPAAEAAPAVEEAPAVEAAQAEQEKSDVISQPESEIVQVDVKKIRGINASNLAGSFYVRASKPAVLVTKDLKSPAQAEMRIDLAAGENKRIQLLPTEVVRVVQGERIEIFYQGYRVPKAMLDSGDWMQLVPATTKSRP